MNDCLMFSYFGINYSYFSWCLYHVCNPTYGGMDNFNLYQSKREACIISRAEVATYLSNCFTFRLKLQHFNPGIDLLLHQGSVFKFVIDFWS